MTSEVYDWVKILKLQLSLTGKVLDIGSLDLTGCVRDLFDDYLGLDQQSGKNVDIIWNAHSLPFRDNLFDVVCCLEVLEHDTNFFLTLAEARRVLKYGGYFLLTARANGYEKHDYPVDYWRFTEDSFNLLLSDYHQHHVGENMLGVYGWAQK